MSTEKILVVQNYLQALQDTICAAIEKEDGQARFQEDAWHADLVKL